MISREQIKKTETYRKSNPIRKKMLLKHRSFKELDHHFLVAKNIGIEDWEALNNGISHSRKEIIRELIINDLEVK